MRVLLNFVSRKTLTIHTMAEDCRTRIGPFLDVQSSATLLRLLRYIGANDRAIADYEFAMRSWGQGSVFVDINDAGLKLLQIRPLSH
ncbi:hypothetical protein [Candidatus Korobacter versatilis]|uniref:hypothetical protein n=1 Tax=Candidatus Korobacter versatilis TaxID=658062 RepID=UPI000306DE4D|nr:hypothetical protein [Candidatus Koribacter versatilis]